MKTVLIASNTDGISIIAVQQLAQKSHFITVLGRNWLNQKL